jgi:hypothetical protein
MKGFAPLALSAVMGVVLWRLAATILLPVFAVAVGLLGTALKLALVGAVVFMMYSMIRRRREEAQA